VCDARNLENEEAKARYRAVKNTTTRVVTPGKQTKQTNHPLIKMSIICD
jgi:hypothetical protein